MNNNFFYRITAADFLAKVAVLTPEERGVFAFQFALDLVSGESEDQYTQSVLAEAVEFREQKSAAGKASAKARKAAKIKELEIEQRSTPLDSVVTQLNTPSTSNSNSNISSNSTVTEEETIKEDKDNTMSGKKPNVPYKRILDMMNGHLQTSFKNTQEFKKLVKARFCDGFTEEEFEVVVQRQLEAWNNDDKMRQYLRPTTLFGNKMNNYLGGNASSNRGPISKREEINRGAIEGFMNGEVAF